MESYAKKLVWIFYLVIFVCFGSCAESFEDCDKDGQRYIIRSAEKDLVLDGTELELKIKYYNGDSIQLWRFIEVDKPGVFQIVNDQTGRALDLILLDSDGYGNITLTTQKEARLEQHWFLNPNNRIVNAATLNFLDIYNGKIIDGNIVGTWKEHSQSKQQYFSLELYI